MTAKLPSQISLPAEFLISGPNEIKKIITFDLLLQAIKSFVVNMSLITLGYLITVMNVFFAFISLFSAVSKHSESKTFK